MRRATPKRGRDGLAIVPGLPRPRPLHAIGACSRYSCHSLGPRYTLAPPPPCPPHPSDTTSPLVPLVSLSHRWLRIVHAHRHGISCSTLDTRGRCPCPCATCGKVWVTSLLVSSRKIMQRVSDNATALRCLSQPVLVLSNTVRELVYDITAFVGRTRLSSRLPTLRPGCTSRERRLLAFPPVIYSDILRYLVLQFTGVGAVQRQVRPETLVSHSANSQLSYTRPQQPALPRPCQCSLCSADLLEAAQSSQ